MKCLKNLHKFGTKQCQVKRNCARDILLSQDSKCYSEYFFQYLKACFSFFSVCIFMEFLIKIKISELILQLHLLQLILARKCCAHKLSRFCLCRFCLLSLTYVLSHKMEKTIPKNSYRNYSRLSYCCFSSQFAFPWYCTLGCLNAKKPFGRLTANNIGCFFQLTEFLAFVTFRGLALYREKIV